MRAFGLIDEARRPSAWSAWMPQDLVAHLGHVASTEQDTLPFFVSHVAKLDGWMLSAPEPMDMPWMRLQLTRCVTDCLRLLTEMSRNNISFERWTTVIYIDTEYRSHRDNCACTLQLDHLCLYGMEERLRIGFFFERQADQALFHLLW